MNTIEELKKHFRRFGFVVPPDAKFWKILHGEYKNKWGMQVGHYEHSCHIESSDIYVLLVAENRIGKGVKVIDKFDTWLSEK